MMIPGNHPALRNFLIIRIVAVLAMAFVASSAPEKDFIEDLPMVGKTPTKHYSGFLDGTAGCDTEANGEFCKIHYWLAMAEDPDPISKPLVLWLNGGPGASSILGFLQELGPFLFNATGGLMENPWSWTKLANVMAIEAPVGVGYSYCAKQAEGGTCKNTDKYTASTTRAALEDFFGSKFPEFAGKEFFITGESYAGVYIPTLTKEILDNADPALINLVGIFVGDPCTDNTSQEDSMDALWYGFKYGLVDEQIYDLLWNQCGYALEPRFKRGDKFTLVAELNQRLREEVEKRQGEEVDQRAIAEEMLDNLSQPKSRFELNDEWSTKCEVAYKKFIWSSSYGLSQGWADLYVDDYALFAPVTEKEDDDMAAYMNKKEVIKALHVEETPTTEWPYDPKIGFDYTSEFAACNDETITDSRSMIDFYREVAPKLKRTWVYNGDADPCVSYEGTRTAIKRVGFDELDGGTYRPWFFNQTAVPLDLLAEKAPLFGSYLLTQDLGAQFGGEVVNYEHGLSFLTVHGSGHMVPQVRPQVALHLLQKLINGEGESPLTPLMPSNATLESITNHEYRVLIREWTDSAKAAPYVTPGSWVFEEQVDDQLDEAYEEAVEK